jgi:uncharacterized OB-fold protein
MKCGKCGNELLENQKFCKSCGYSLKLSEEDRKDEIETWIKAIIGLIIYFLIIYVSIKGGI